MIIRWDNIASRPYNIASLTAVNSWSTSVFRVFQAVTNRGGANPSSSPSVTGIPAALRWSITGRGIDLTSKEIGLQLIVPIFSGFAVQSRVREALENQERVLQDLNNTHRDTELKVSQEYLNTTNGMALVKAQTEAVRSSQSQVESTKLGQEVGIRTEVDVLNAQGLHSIARRDLGRGYYNLLISRLRLEAEAGELDEEDLVQINEVLQ